MASLLHYVSLCICAAVFSTQPLLALETTATVEGDGGAALPSETKEQHDKRMTWFRDARYGMFIHWGLYSVPAGSHENKKPAGDGYAEWLQNDAQISGESYADYTKGFNPEKFDADTWVRLAHDAGAKYIVFTAKHHEGYAMFQTKASSFNLLDTTPFKRDPVKELAEAARKYGLKLGLYYSQNLDWHHPGGGGGGWDPKHSGDPDKYVDSIVIPQLRELLTNYGDIAMIWWDIPGGAIDKKRAERILKVVHELAPNVVMNNRLGGGFPGDTETPEQIIPVTGFPGRDWEACMTINNTWGYSETDRNYKSATILLRNLIDIASKGGNYLINVGPDAKGIIPEPQVERLREVGKWLKVNGDAIYGTQASPLPKPPSWGRITQKEDRLFLNIFYWPKDGKLVLPIRNIVKGARLLAAPDSDLKVEKDAHGSTITLPAIAPDAIASVITVEIDGAVDPLPPAPLQPQVDNSFQLNASDADFVTKDGSAPRINLENSSEGTHIGFWTRAEDLVQWKINVPVPGAYQVTVEYAASDKAKENTFLVEAGDQPLHAAVRSTGSWETYDSISLGTVNFMQSGEATVSIKPENILAGSSLFNLRSIRLTPTSREVIYSQNDSSIYGKSFLPLGIFGVTPPDFTRVAKYGFNIVQTYDFSKMSPEEIGEYLDGAERHGLKVLFHLGVKTADEATAEKMRKQVVRFKDHPALYAWYLADEPSVKRIQPKDLATLYRWIKNTDPSHPVFSSNWELEDFRDACDVDMPQLYSGPPSAQRMGALPYQRQVREKTGVDWIGIANTHDVIEFRAFSPSGAETLSPAILLGKDPVIKTPVSEDKKKVARERIKIVRENMDNPPFEMLGTYPDSLAKIRGQAFDLIAHGSNGLFYWILQPEGSMDESWGFYTVFARPALREALKITLAELQSLWPRIKAPAQNALTWYEPEFGNIFLWLRNEPELATVIAVNESEVEHTIKATLPGLENIEGAVAHVSNENRTVTVRNGVLEDRFGPNEAHIYLFDLK